MFLGLRYELLGNFVEKNDLLINFDPVTASLVLPNDGITAFLAPDAQTHGARVTAAQAGVPRAWSTPTRTTSARASALPGASARKPTVIRGGTGLFYPTPAAQGIRDALSRSPFRYGVRATSRPSPTRSPPARSSPRRGFGVNAVDLDLREPEVLQYNVTLERELANTIGVRVSFIGSRCASCWSTATSTRCRRARRPSISTIRPQLNRLPYPNLDPFLNASRTPATAGSARCRSKCAGRFQRPAVRGGLHARLRRRNAPDLGNSVLGVVQYNPYDLEQDRGPDPNMPRHRFIMNATWELPVGRDRRIGSSMPGWADAVAGGWTVAASSRPAAATS